MSNTDQDIERLIVRCLDGVLAEDEQLTLNRELIRDPEARRLMDDYRRADELAAAALAQAFGDDTVGFDPSSLPDQAVPQVQVGVHRGWWMATGAVAAAMLAIFVGLPPLSPTPGSGLADGGPEVPLVQGPLRSPVAGAIEAPMRNASTAPQINRSTGRDVLGVLGDDGNIYWLEIDRSRTVRRPRGRAAAGGPLEEM